MASRNATTAAVASTPATTPHACDAVVRHPVAAQGRRRSTTTHDRGDGLGDRERQRSPASSGTWPSAAKRSAEAEPGEHAVEDARGQVRADRRRARGETSQIAGSGEQRCRPRPGAPGRSPVADADARPGRRAAPTAETGATTPIRPGRQAAVEERRTEAVADAGERAPRRGRRRWASRRRRARGPAHQRGAGQLGRRARPARRRRTTGEDAADEVAEAVGDAAATSESRTAIR